MAEKSSREHKEALTLSEAITTIEGWSLNLALLSDHAKEVGDEALAHARMKRLEDLESIIDLLKGVESL